MTATARRVAISTTSIGADKRGNPRIWIEGRKLEKSGFVPQARYRMQINPETRTITLELDDAGDRVVSRRKRGNSDCPIIDIANIRALTPLKEAETLRIDFARGTVTIEPSAVEARRIDREQRTKGRLKAGVPLRTGSASTGLGVLSLAIHEGLENAGLASELAFSVEIDPEYQDLCAERNPCWRDDTLAINMPLQEFAFDPRATHGIEQVDILEAGIPCTAHSISGRAKKHLAKPEDDPVAGHLVVGFLAIVAATNPTVVIVENVPQYATSASYAILVNQLREWQYDVHLNILKGEDYGCLENRHRMAMVATSRGLNADIVMSGTAAETARLGDFLDDIPDDSPLWSSMDYLKAKEERDIADGKGFRMQILDGTATKVGTIGRGYAKCRSTEAKVRHPNDPALLRQLTPCEHARIKGIPEAMIAELPVTIAHEMLGQSIVSAPFRALGRALGEEILMWVSDAPRQARPSVINAPIHQPATHANCNAADTRQLGLFAF